MKLVEFKLPSKLYHVASLKNLGSIKARGLLPVKDYILHGTDQDVPGVNLLTSINHYYKPFDKDEVVITVSTAGLDPQDFTKFDKTWYRYGQTIPSKNILRVAQPGKRTSLGD